MLPKCLAKRQAGLNCQHLANHGIGCDEYAEIVVWAGVRCQICGIHGAETARGELVLDHLASKPADPVPHCIRGMICDKCNSLMARVDGRMPWGTDRTNEEAALRYAANAWHLTHKAQPPHRVPDVITKDVRFGFMGIASTARIHRLRRAWVDHSENRATCGNKLWLPAHPEVVRLYLLCKSCAMRST